MWRDGREPRERSCYHLGVMEDRDDAYYRSTLRQLAQNLEQYAPPTCARFGIPKKEHEDLMQEVLTAYWKRRKRVRKPEKWVAGALRNQCFEYLRNQTQRKSRPFQEDLRLLQVTMGSAARPSEEKVFLQSDIDEALSQIKRKQRTLLILRFREGMTPAEAAEHLGYEESSMKKVTNRAIRALRKQMRENGYRSSS